MKKNGGDLIQTVEWKAGNPLTAGRHDGIFLIHCVEDGDLTAHFITGDETRSFVTGDDFSLANVDVTVVSGSFDLN